MAYKITMAAVATATEC